MTHFQATRPVRPQTPIAVGLAPILLSACGPAADESTHALGDEVDTTFYSLLSVP